MQVSKVTAYYSIDPSDPDVWHDFSQCPSGQQIPERNRREGKPIGYTHCGHCVKLI